MGMKLWLTHLLDELALSLSIITDNYGSNVLESQSQFEIPHKYTSTSNYLQLKKQNKEVSQHF